jgi:hypothetical protein
MNDTAAKNVQLWEDLTMFRQNLMMRHPWGEGLSQKIIKTAGLSCWFSQESYVEIGTFFNV